MHKTCWEENFCACATDFVEINRRRNVKNVEPYLPAKFLNEPKIPSKFNTVIVGTRVCPVFPHGHFLDPLTLTMKALR
jgi:hypothetical protein